MLGIYITIVDFSLYLCSRYVRVRG